MKIQRKTLLAIAAVCCAIAQAACVQSTLGQGTGSYGSYGNIGNAPSQTVTPAVPALDPLADGPPPQMEHKQERLRNLDRQKQLVLDTQKLLALANELKVEVDKSNKDTMSLDVIRKAEEIEKLAHAVKEKMKGV
jgi:hypothetical protein